MAEESPLDGASPVEAFAQHGYTEELEAFVKALPKVELHVHLDGSFDDERLFRYLQENKDVLESLPEETTLPWDQSLWPVRKMVSECKDVADLQRICTCRGKRSLKEMIKCFEIFIPILKGRLELVEEMAFDFCRRQAEQNIVYTEMRYTPHLLAKGASLSTRDPVDAVPVMDAVTRGLRRGCEHFGITVNQILCCICWRPDWAEEIVRMADEKRNDFPCAIVAVDIAAGEEHFDEKSFSDLYEPHKQAMELARRLKLNITIHAGEVGGSENVLTALEYGATRVGHGYAVANDEETMKKLREKGVHCEVCPTSSRETGGWTGSKWSEHPVVTMMEHGISAGLNSDDPAVFDTSLTWQLRIALAKINLPKSAVLKTLSNSIDAAFCDDEQKQKLHNLLQPYYDGEDTDNGDQK